MRRKRTAVVGAQPSQGTVARREPRPAFHPGRAGLDQSRGPAWQSHAIRALDPQTSAALIAAFADALERAFLFAVPPMALAFVVFLFVRHRDLPTELDVGDVGDEASVLPGV